MDTWERARRVLDAAGLPPDDLADRRPLGGGTYNTVEELRLTDGTRYVLKIPPPPSVPSLAYERELLAGEAEFCRAAAAVEVPAPRVVGACLDASAPTGRHLLLTHCPGEPWGDDLAPEEHTSLRRELGHFTARLHRVTGPGFGYPSGVLGSLTPTGAPPSPPCTTPYWPTPAATGPGCPGPWTRSRARPRRRMTRWTR